MSKQKARVVLDANDIRRLQSGKTITVRFLKTGEELEIQYQRHKSPDGGLDKVFDGMDKLFKSVFGR